MGVLLSQGFSELEVVQQRHQNGQAHPGQDGLGGVRLVMAPVDDGLDQQKGEQDREDKKQEYHHKRDLLSQGEGPSRQTHQYQAEQGGGFYPKYTGKPQKEQYKMENCCQIVIKGGELKKPPARVRRGRCRCPPRRL